MQSTSYFESEFKFPTRSPFLIEAYLDTMHISSMLNPDSIPIQIVSCIDQKLNSMYLKLNSTQLERHRLKRVTKSAINSVKLVMLRGLNAFWVTQANEVLELQSAKCLPKMELICGNGYPFEVVWKWTTNRYGSRVKCDPLTPLHLYY